MEKLLVKKKIPPLLIEHQDDDTNMHLFSMIEYHRNEYICIIDDITSVEIKAFILDKHFNDIIDRSHLISEAIQWFYSASHRHQLSIELAKKGLTELIGPLYRKFELNGVSRVIGKPFIYPQLSKVKVKRKRVISIPEGIEIHFKRGSIKE